jgi:hypothetical protein
MEKKMKILNIVCCFIMGVLVLGCTVPYQPQYGRAKHNGKIYWSPINCTEIEIDENDSDIVHCMKDGNFTGVTLKPANPDDVALYMQEKQIEQNIREQNRRDAEYAQEQWRKAGEAWGKALGSR